MDNAYLEDLWSRTPSSIEMRKSTIWRPLNLKMGRIPSGQRFIGCPMKAKVLPAIRIVRRLLSIPNSPCALFSRIIENIRGHIGMHTRSLRLTLKRHVR
jgi:hypothetical protein